MYGKIFSSMYEGTLFGQWEAIVTLQQFIVLADEEGVVDMTPPAIAAKTSIPLEIIEKGIETLSQPDKYSRSPKDDGRRIKLLDDERPWGWQIVNYRYYRDLATREEKKRRDRERIAEKRKKDNKNKGVADCREPSQGVSDVAHTDTDTDKDKKGASKLPPWLPEEAWKEFVAFRRKKAPLTDRAKTLAINKLDQLRHEGHDPAAVIDQSILNGWRGLFPLKDGPNMQPTESPIKWANRRAVEMGEKEWPGPAGGETQQQYIDRIKQLDREAA